MSGETLTQLDAEGLPRMVDVGDKASTRRRAVAGGFLALGEACAAALEGAMADRPLKKGDPWAVARLGAVMAAKRTSDLIPLAHPLVLDAVTVEHHWDATRRRAWFMVEVRVQGRTGVEMEALTAVTGGLLVLYDMLKAAGQDMELGPVRLLLKEGGRHGRILKPWPEAPWDI